MDDASTDPLSTFQLFRHRRVAAGYASARPVLHPQVFARVRDLVTPSRRLARALDVGCGTGMSARAMLDLAERVVGIDASPPMLRVAKTAEGPWYVASTAEDLPFPGRSFDLIAACGSMDWVDRARFVPRAAHLLVSGGFFVPLDFGDLGRSDEIPGLGRWYEDVFSAACPRPPARDPMVTPAEAASCGFTEPAHHELATSCSFTGEEYADFLMTESNVTAAVEYGGRSAERLRAWLGAELAPLFGNGPRKIAFGGYIQVLRRL